MKVQIWRYLEFPYFVGEQHQICRTPANGNNFCDNTIMATSADSAFNVGFPPFCSIKVLYKCWQMLFISY